LSVQLANFLPWVSFVAGIGGSLHCVGMCGGLVTASCANTTDVTKYQVGRLLGYLILGSAAGLIGNMAGGIFSFRYASLVSAIIMGSVFIYWGVQNLMGKRAEIPVPKIFRSTYQWLWKHLVKSNSSFARSFFIGLISIMLPCGLLYGIVLSTLAINHFSDIFVSLLFFWLGTLPAMIMAPALVQKVLRPFKAQMPKLYAFSLIIIGLLTIGQRLQFPHQDAHASSAPVHSSSTNPAHRCH